MEEHKISEEVSVTPVIRDFERLFLKGVRSVKRLINFILEGISEFFVLALKYFLILFLAAILGGLVGFFSTEFFPRQYASTMILKLNVDAKEQLINDVSFFNALIGRGDTDQLSTLLNLSEEEAASLTQIEIYAYSDFIEKTRGLQDLYVSMDTALFNALELEKLVDEGSDLISSRFKIIISATQQDVFKKMETPLLAYFERVPELNELLVSSQKALKFQREVYVREMESLDTLSEVMNRVMMTQAAHPSTGAGDMSVIMGPEPLSNTDISPIDIQDRYVFYAQRINKIDNDLQMHTSCYFVNSHLNPYGEKIGTGRLSRAFLGAFVCFTLIYLIVGFRHTRKNAA